MVVFWFRRDLRLDDNTGLLAALASGKPVLPIFIFDKNILNELPATDARVSFIARSLDQIQETLQKFGSSLAVFHDTPESVFRKLAETEPIEAVYTNEDYEPYARHREATISGLLSEAGIQFRTFKDQVVFSPVEILKDDGLPYVVYTPYSRKWIASFEANPPKVYHLPENPAFARHDFPYLTLGDIGFQRSDIQVPPFNLSRELVNEYGQTRDFPEKSTSRLGPHLRFGTVSVRQAARLAYESESKTLLSELIWREFFMQILWHLPHTATRSFRPDYDGIQWRNDPAEFDRWKNGETGIPIVDAGMRELNTTGFMHNRVRMIVASFLCKNLLIDWRWGEAYFAMKLLDYDMSANVGNWQWAAGSGVDAAPYFRVFNPQTQALKFDPLARYIRKWVPELDSLEYPMPMVDLKTSRERAIATYKRALSSDPG